MIVCTFIIQDIAQNTKTLELLKKWHIPKGYSQNKKSVELVQLKTVDSDLSTEKNRFW